MLFLLGFLIFFFAPPFPLGDRHPGSIWVGGFPQRKKPEGDCFPTACCLNPLHPRSICFFGFVHHHYPIFLTSFHFILLSYFRMCNDGGDGDVMVMVMVMVVIMMVMISMMTKRRRRHTTMLMQTTTCTFSLNLF